jgi:hypothetical protein
MQFSIGQLFPRSWSLRRRRKDRFAAIMQAGPLALGQTSRASKSLGPWPPTENCQIQITSIIRIVYSKQRTGRPFKPSVGLSGAVDLALDLVPRT